ncbi:hypothetical protein Catovirus_1_818 [Catovirus CTV1]|uniref:C2H2-type domain-containing protein n=1 Tax=Catovirus CTV1 TaxID=1977631 RepID=A0A1V0SAT8_9VIRU|nr:hypothetical protein Catovirus_1_818 [Catovirus CTV1]
MKYQCIICNYETDDKSNWSKHKKSKKHKNKESESTNLLDKSLMNPQPLPSNSKKNICKYCNITFTQTCHLSRHIKKCSEKYHTEQITILQQENNQIKSNSIIKTLKEKIKSLEQQKNFLEKENEYHKQLVISAGNLIQSSMSTLNHLVINYNNAPILEPLKDYSVLEEKDKFIGKIIYYNNEKKLDEYLGKFLVKHYKSKDPSKQSNWNSDTSRLTYINRELVNNKPNWVIDKKGVKMTNTIIDPLLNYVKKISQDELILLNELRDDMDGAYDVNKVICLTDIIQKINSNALSNDINKYLAPYFYFDKNNALVLSDNKEIIDVNTLSHQKQQQKE